MKHFPRWLLILLVSPLVLAATERPRPNVLFIAIDDLRNDLGALGATYAQTPQLDDANEWRRSRSWSKRTPSLKRACMTLPSASTSGAVVQ